MSKSDIAQAPFSGLFLKIQEDLWFLGVGEMVLREGFRLAKGHTASWRQSQEQNSGLQSRAPSLSNQHHRLPGDPPLGKVTIA